jgi:hypothetical protein
MAVVSWVSSVVSFGSCSIGEGRLELRAVGQLRRARMAPVVLLLLGEKGQKGAAHKGEHAGRK